MRFILTILLLNCVTAYSQQDKVFGSIEQAFITPAEVETLKVVCTVPENGTKEIDSLKKYIDRFEHLKYLSISECGGKLGQIPKCVTKLKELKRLDFFYNEINDEVDWNLNFKIISEVESLEELVLGPYSSFKTIPKSITKLKNLKVLNLNMTDLNTVPSFIYQLDKLEVLNLSTTQVKDLPESLLKAKSLKKVYLVGVINKKHHQNEIDALKNKFKDAQFELIFESEQG